MPIRVGVHSTAWHLVLGGAPHLAGHKRAPHPYTSNDGAQPWGFSLGLGVGQRLWAGMH